MLLSALALQAALGIEHLQTNASLPTGSVLSDFIDSVRERIAEYESIRAAYPNSSIVEMFAVDISLLRGIAELMGKKDLPYPIGDIIGVIHDPELTDSCHHVAIELIERIDTVRQGTSVNPDVLRAIVQDLITFSNGAQAVENKGWEPLRRRILAA